MKHIIKKSLIITLFLACLIKGYGINVSYIDTAATSFKIKENKEQEFIGVLVQGLIKSDLCETIPYYNSSIGFSMFMGNQILKTRATPEGIVDALETLLRCLPLYTAQIGVTKVLTDDVKTSIVLLECTSIKDKSIVHIAFYFTGGKIFKVHCN